MSDLSRRALLGLTVSTVAMLVRPGFANEPKLPRLIEEARDIDAISPRIDGISRGFLGSRYIHDPLGGGPREHERLTLREDGFDCVTFVETVLAAARVRRFDRFADAVRRIRYRDGEVGWFARNHYFALWGLNNTAAGIVRPLWLPGGVPVVKTLTYMHSLPPAPAAFAAIPRESLFARPDLLRTGDIAGFISQRSSIDVFHTGLIVNDDGNLLLRHASKSRGRVMQQPLAQFMTENGTREVALWRPLELGDMDVLV